MTESVRVLPFVPLLRALAVSVCLAVATAAVGCGGDAEDGRVAESEPAEARSDGPGLRGDTLVVELDDFAIVIPDTLPARELHIVARNIGVEDHNLEIVRGDERFWEFDRVVGPQQTQEAVLALEPGEYSVLCTVSGHDGRGMVTRITVVEVPQT